MERRITKDGINKISRSDDILIAVDLSVHGKCTSLYIVPMALLFFVYANRGLKGPRLLRGYREAMDNGYAISPETEISR